ncbi:hypothetical protein CNEO3_960001 [Clostridium neonatale]|nr:hypothetical protein CNEO3_960001 [Clostridium neonatale]
MYFLFHFVFSPMHNLIFSRSYVNLDFNIMNKKHPKIILRCLKYDKFLLYHRIIPHSLLFWLAGRNFSSHKSKIYEFCMIA